MDKRFLILLCIFTLILSNTLAATTLAVPVITPSSTTDLNYFKFPIDINTIATGGVGDLNILSQCWYGVSNYDINFPATWLNDFNTCSVEGYSSAGIDDFNFRMKVQNGARDTNFTSPVIYAWLDTNAPTTTATPSGLSDTRTVTLTCVDHGMNTLLGGGCGVTQYRINGGDWQTYTSPFTLTSRGDNRIDFNSSDVFGNRETSNSTTVYVGTISTSTCGFLWIIPLVVAALVVIIILGIMAKGDLETQDLMVLLATAVTAVIGVIILSLILSGTCAVI